MNVGIEDFKTGWFGLQVGLRPEDIDNLIKRLEQLKKDIGHFHIFSDCEGPGGVGDIQFYVQGENQTDNVSIG